MRTPQQALADALKSGAVQAWIDGKNIRARTEGKSSWDEFEGHSKRPAFTSPDLHWRPAPTSRLRSWKDGLEVPKQAIYRDKSWVVDCWSLILGASSAGIEVSKHDCVTTISLETALENGEHSLDGGKTWAPCGVMEGGE